jgi:uncharacterized protein (UPF0332 family)
VSRAYYCAFHRAKKKLSKEDVEVSHALVWDEIEDGPAPLGAEIAGLGRALRNRRNTADYEARVIYGWDKKAADAIAKAEQIGALLIQLSSAPPSSPTSTPGS